MAWDPTEPTDTTKLRDLGIVIRPNWVAIQDADSTFKPHAINFTDRTVAALPVDPTAIPDAYITYCKTDAAGNSELFGINENSGIIQFTRGVPTLTATGTTFLPGGLILKWGGGALSGSSQAFPVAFPNGAFTMFVTGTSTLYTGGFVVNALSASHFTVTRTSGSGATGYYYLALGY